MADRGEVRIAELIATLSYAADLGLGQPMEHCLRHTVMARRLADLPGVRFAEPMSQLARRVTRTSQGRRYMPPSLSPRPPRGRTARRLTRPGNPRFSIGGGTKATVERRLHKALPGRLRKESLPVAACNHKDVRRGDNDRDRGE